MGSVLKRRFRKFLLLGAVVMSGIFIFVNAQNNRAMKSFEAANYVYQGNVLRSYSSGSDASKPVLFLLHGAPGSASAFKKYLADSLLRSHFEVVAVDRPGYGASNRGDYVDIKSQAEFLRSWMDSMYKHRTHFVFGHSYGATIAALLMVFPSSNLKKSMLFAPALDPDAEKYFPLGKLTVYPFSKWLFPRAWRVAGMEKYEHAKELKGLTKEWAEASIPALYVHGDKDNIVPYSNFHFAQKVFPDSLLEMATLKGEGHLGVFTKHSGVVKLMHHYFILGQVFDGI